MTEITREELVQKYREQDLCVCTDVSAYQEAVDKFAKGGGRNELIERLVAIGVAADDIRYLAEFPGRSLTAVSF